jgi:formylglycine-generating enzyme required for sulfatase activity
MESTWMNRAHPTALHDRTRNPADLIRFRGRRWVPGALVLGCLGLSPGTPAQQPAPLLEDGLVRVQAGQFRMGSPGSEIGRNGDEGPVHAVKLRAFALARYPVTRAEYADFVKATGRQSGSACLVWNNERFEAAAGADWLHPGFEQTDREPAVCVSWSDARAYVAWLSGKTGKQYRLPSEAEYEYAARAGTSGVRFWDPGDQHACDYADVADSTAQHLVPGGDRWTVHPCDDGHAFTAPVGSYKPNPFGLYDMLGNVWEWVEDCYHPSYEEAPADGGAWAEQRCSQHVLRGGSWAGYPDAVRSALRLWFGPDVRLNVMGFRVARSLP